MSELNSEIDIIDEGFEIFDNISGNNRMFVPLMDEYPSPKNQFDIQMGVDGERTDAQILEDTAKNLGKVATALTKTEEEKNLKLRCGRRPLLAKNRATYDACAEKFFSENSIGRSSLQPYIPTNTTSDSGLSTGAVVGIVLGAVALTVAGYFVYKSMASAKK